MSSQTHAIGLSHAHDIAKIAELESKLREQIAKEIRAAKCDYEMPDDDCVTENSALEQAACIAEAKTEVRE